MNKLVSKNPVQRFKQGRKIVKAQKGVKTSRRTPGGQIIYDNNFSEPGFFSRFWNYLTSPQQSRVGMNGKPIVDTTQKNPSQTVQQKDYVPLGEVQAMRQKYLGKSNMDVAEEETHNYLEGLRNKYVRPFNKKNNSLTKTVIPVNNYYLKGFENRKAELAQQGKTVRDIQKMLGFTGKDLDGKWGQNTEDAYNRYLQSKQQQSAPTLPSTTDLIQHITNQINFNKSQQTPVQPVEIEQPTPVINGSSTPSIYDQLQIAKEQAEKPLNIQYKPLEMPSEYLAMLMGKYKQGGQLVSRNPIKRFKNRK